MMHVVLLVSGVALLLTTCRPTPRLGAGLAILGWGVVLALLGA